MKTVALIMLLTIAAVSVCSADEIGTLLSNVAEPLQQQAREMVRAGIPPQEAAAMTRSMVQSRFTQQQAVRAQQMVIQAARRGLPAQPVMAKAMEGIAKNAPPESIIRAMEQVRSRYAFAHTQAQQLAIHEPQAGIMTHAIAGSLAAGLTQADMTGLMAQVQRRTRNMRRSDAAELTLAAMHAARTMALTGVSSSAAAGLAGQAVAHAYTPRQLNRLQEVFRSQAMKTSPQKLAESLSRSFAAGQDPLSGMGPSGQGQPSHSGGSGSVTGGPEGPSGGGGSPGGGGGPSGGSGGGGSGAGGGGNGGGGGSGGGGGGKR